MKTKKLLLALLLGLVITILLPSCFREKKPIRIAVNSWPSCELWYIAKDQGYFEDLPVEIVRFTNWTDSIASLYLGKTDLTHSTYFNSVYYAGRGEKSKIILITETIFGNQGMVAKSEINEIDDLKGRRIAVETNTDEHFLLCDFLRENGISEKDIDIVPASSLKNASELFIEGKVDAAVTCEPFISDAVNKGNGKILIQSNKNMVSTDVILAREKSLKARPEDYAKIVKAWYKAQDYVKNNPENAYNLMASKEKMAADEFRNLFEKFIFFSIEENIEELSSDKVNIKLKDLKKFMLENKLTDVNLDTSTLYDSSVIEIVKGDM